MSAAILQTSQIHLAISTPFHIPCPDPMAPEPSSRLAESTPSPAPDAQLKTFRRLRSSLEQSIRSATKSRAAKLPSVDETGTVTSKSNKGKEKVSVEPVLKDTKSKSGMLNVSFRRSRRDTSSPLPPSEAQAQGKHKHKNSENITAGLASFLTPSLRQASFSSPVLHMPAEMVSSSNAAGRVSPPRERKRTSAQSAVGVRDISAPVLLTPRRTSGQTSGEDLRSPKHRPPPLLPSSPSTPSFSMTRTRNVSPSPQTPPKRDRYPPLESPTPHLRGTFARSQTAGASTSQLTLNGPALSPTPRGTSPARARSPSIRHSPPSPPSSRLLSSSPSDNVRRRSQDPQKPRKSSSDIQRPAGSPARTTSPAIQARPSAVSPSHSPTRNFSPSYSQNRHFNMSTSSLSSPVNPEYRELIRNASSILCKELLKPPGHNTTGLGNIELEEVEVRMRALARLERIWGRSGATASGSNIMLSTSGLSSNGLSAAGEDRERRLFSEALRDGYVLCQLINKVRPGSIARVDKREDGAVRTSNVTKFLASCSTLGLSSSDLFMRDDLIEASFESLARVARTIIAVIQISENPPQNRAKYLYGRPSQGKGPYSQDTVSRGAVSSPSLILSQAHQRLTSPEPSAPISIVRKGWGPSGLPPVFADDSPDSGNDSDNQTMQIGKTRHADDYDEMLPIPTPPPRSPLRPKPSAERSSFTDSGSSFNDIMRQSVATSNITDTTTCSSLLEMRSISGQNRYGTIRTVTTDATSIIASETPSFTRTEASSIAPSLVEELGRKRHGVEKQRERKPSETAIVDLSRVAEETEDGCTSSRGKSSKGSEKVVEPEVEKPKLKLAAIQLGKGKWPDDFFDPPPTNSSQSQHSDVDDLTQGILSDSPKSAPLLSTPPRKVAIVGRGNDNAESLPQFPRRPTHRARHSLDVPGLLPKETVFRRDSSPDDRSPHTSRVMLRRNSNQAGAQRSGVHLPRSNLEENGSQVPFPRAVSGDHGTANPTKERSVNSGSSIPDKPALNERPRVPRGRFQSEIDGSSSRRRPRPSSYDELGANPRRSRFESMVNLGAVSGSASASDLLSRNSPEGTTVRPTLIVREEGKTATQFQLGNCIGRGQFGSVYRALNLNTGQMVAVKRISLSGLKEEEISQLMKEVDLLKSLSHPGIVKYEGMARDQDTLSIVLEYAENGSLGQTLKAFGKLNERLVASYVVKILEGLHYLHQSDVVHCDLKAANILTTKNGNVKLSDFGVSLNLRAMEREMKDVAGTPNWMAPEVIELKGASPKSDIWSLACTVIELLTGRPPYAEIANGMSVMFRIVEDVMPPLPGGISDSLADFLKQCFNKDPSKRPDADILCEHEWLKKNWGQHKELRPQDSIPFLRRVSADLQKTTAAEAVRLLVNDPPAPETPPQPLRPNDIPPRRLSNTDQEPISPQEHSFVETTFGKPVVCRVCLLAVKRSAVLCDQCSLIAHSKCAANAPPTCNLRTQLLLYAQYADKGTPPMEILGHISANPPSDGYISRTSLDALSPPAPSPPQSPHSDRPPIAYKPTPSFKPSQSTLLHDSGKSSSSSSRGASSRTREKKVVKKPSLLKRARKQSISSNGTSPDPSMRSAATNSLRDATHSVTQNALSEGDETDHAQSSRMTGYSVISTLSDYGEPLENGIPGSMTSGKRPKKRPPKESTCTIQ